MYVFSIVSFAFKLAFRIETITLAADLLLSANSSLLEFNSSSMRCVFDFIVSIHAFEMFDALSRSSWMYLLKSFNAIRTHSCSDISECKYRIIIFTIHLWSYVWISHTQSGSGKREISCSRPNIEHCSSDGFSENVLSTLCGILMKSHTTCSKLMMATTSHLWQAASTLCAVVMLIWTYATNNREARKCGGCDAGLCKEREKRKRIKCWTMVPTRACNLW